MTEHTNDRTEQDLDAIALKMSLQFSDGPVGEIRAIATAASYSSCIVIGVEPSEGQPHLVFDICCVNVPHSAASLADVLDVLAMGIRKGHVMTPEEFDDEDFRPPQRRVDDVVDNVP